MAHILNFSGGKDSTAMLLMILEKGLPLDYIINVDTTKEFPQMYDHIEQVKKYTGREIITLKVEFDFFFKERFGKTEFRGQIGYGWPNLAFRWCTWLKREAYSIGAVDTCAAGFGAPHIRQRLYWVADADSKRWQGRTEGLHKNEHPLQIERQGPACRLGDSDCQRLERHAAAGFTRERERETGHNRQTSLHCNTSPQKTFWGNPDWLFCRDQKWRPVESGAFPLAYGPASVVGEVRGYGNAIVAPQAQAFIETYLECRQCQKSNY